MGLDCTEVWTFLKRVRLVYKYRCFCLENTIIVQRSFSRVGRKVLRNTVPFVKLVTSTSDFHFGQRGLTVATYFVVFRKAKKNLETF